MVTSSGERMVYIKGTRAARDKALELIRGNPKVRDSANRTGNDSESTKCMTLFIRGGEVFLSCAWDQSFLVFFVAKR